MNRRKISLHTERKSFDRLSYYKNSVGKTAHAPLGERLRVWGGGVRAGGVTLNSIGLSLKGRRFNLFHSTLQLISL